jgi:hypothetical protein
MLKYKKFIEALRWYGVITIGLFMGFTGNIVVGLAVAIILGLIDQIFVKPRLKPKDDEK